MLKKNELEAVELTVKMPHKCEFYDYNRSYSQGYDDRVCNEPAPFLLVYGKDEKIWVCEYHKGEQEKEHAKAE